jgi:large subunit ribosomal protein L16
MEGPKSMKYRKMFGPKVQKDKEELKYKNPAFGIFVLKVIESGFITSWELEAARKTLKKQMKKRGKIWVGVFPDQSISKKPTEIRMGKGKGPHSYWVANVSIGRIIFELSGINKKDLNEVYAKVKERIALKTEICKLKE